MSTFCLISSYCTAEILCPRNGVSQWTAGRCFTAWEAVTSHQEWTGGTKAFRCGVVESKRPVQYFVNILK